MHLSSLAVPGALVRFHKGLNKAGWAADSLLFRRALGGGRGALLLRRLYGRKAELVCDFLERQPAPPRLVAARKRMLYVDFGERFYKLALEPKHRRQLRLEYRNWCELNGAPQTRALVADWLELEECEGMTVLVSQRLDAITQAQHLAAAQRVTQGLLRAGEPIGAPAVPEIAAAARMVAGLNGGRLPPGFARAEELERALGGRLLVGPSHHDLHRANMMVDPAGDFRVIDLKSMRLEAVQSFGILTSVMKEQVLRDGGNLIDTACAAQQRDWKLQGYEPLLRLVDLPRPLWGQLFVLWLLGQRLVKRGPAAAPSAPRQWAERLLISPVFRRRWGWCTLVFGGGLAVGAGLA